MGRREKQLEGTEATFFPTAWGCRATPPAPGPNPSWQRRTGSPSERSGPAGERPLYQILPPSRLGGRPRQASRALPGLGAPGEARQPRAGAQPHRVAAKHPPPTPDGARPCGPRLRGGSAGPAQGRPRAGGAVGVGSGQEVRQASAGPPRPTAGAPGQRPARARRSPQPRRPPGPRHRPTRPHPVPAPPASGRGRWAARAGAAPGCWWPSPRGLRAGPPRRARVPPPPPPPWPLLRSDGDKQEAPPPPAALYGAAREALRSAPSRAPRALRRRRSAPRGGPLGNVVRLGVARMRGGASRQGAGGEGGRAIPRRPPGSPPTLPGRLRRSLLGAAEAAGPWQEGAQVYFRYNAPLCFTGTVLFLLLPAEVSSPDTQAELKSTAQNPRSCLNQMKETTKQRPVTAWRAQTTRQTFKTKLLCPGRQGESCRHTNCWAKQNCNASKGYKKKPNPTLKVRGDRAPWEDRGELLTKVQAAAPRDLRGDSGPKGTTITSGRPTPSLAYWRLSRGLEILSPARQSSPAPLLGERARNAASDMGAQNHDRFKRGPWLIFHFNFPLLYKEQEKAMKTLGINMMLSNTAQPVLWWHLGDIFGSFPASHLTTPLTTMNNAWAWWWSQFYL